MNTLRSAQLSAAYRYCRKLNAQHGRTFFLATTLLPAERRRYVHALYGFARYADDLVDRPSAGRPPARRLAELRSDVEEALSGRYGSHPVVRALSDTVHTYDIDPDYVRAFLDSMESDLSVDRYASFADLKNYMWGSACVVGLELLPILGVPGDPSRAKAAAGHASDLAIAFQLTNFIRDVAEDWRRGRVYLPQDSLAAHAVTGSMFGAPTASPQVRALIAAEVQRARCFYRRAEPGIAMLDPVSQDCVRTAHQLYGEILDEVERLDYDVLSRRAAVSIRRRVIVGARGFGRAWQARRRASG